MDDPFGDGFDPDQSTAVRRNSLSHSDKPGGTANWR
jgi:hypothetical protein